jgi:hypothetical protein
MREKTLHSLGGHELLLELPSHWNFVLDDNVIPVTSMEAVIDVNGLFVGSTRQATGNFYSLVNAFDNTVNRNLIEVKMDVSESECVQTWLHSEYELQKLLERPEKVCLNLRIRLPRIIAGGIYWPPSARVQKRINELMRAFEAGEIADPRPFSFPEIEGFNIHTAFEAVAEEYHLNLIEQDNNKYFN